MRRAMITAIALAAACALPALAPAPFGLASAAAQGDIKAPRGNWQVPKEFQKPRDVWQKPGDIQVPKGIQAVKVVVVRTRGVCERRLAVVADALFDFDKFDLRSDAEETLTAAVPEIKKLGAPARVEGHTDGKGSHDYNQKLSEARAKTVRDWLAKRGVIPAATPVRGYGRTRPVAPNTLADGRDNPEGRQQNRRVEVIFAGCA